MDLPYLFFENPWKLYLVLALAEAILGACWYARRNRGLLLALIVPPLLGLAAGLVAHFVVTDREQIAGAMGEIGEGVSRGCLVPASHYLDANYSVPLPGGSTVNRDELLATAQNAMTEHHVSDVSLRNVETKIAGRNATTLLSTRIVLSEGMFDISWRLQWAKRSDGWRIIRVEITKPEWLPALAGLRMPT